MQQSEPRADHAPPRPSAGTGEEVLICADLVLPIESDPIHQGAVWIGGGHIQAVGPADRLEREASSSVRRVRYPGAALLPGFVNAHAHLELSSMLGRIPRPAVHQEDFTHWIRHVLAIREGWGEAEFNESASYGARLLLRGGTTTIGDVTASGTSLQPIIASGLRAIIFREVLGFGAEREALAHEVCVDWMARASAAVEGSGGRVSLALSPHAPHSTSSGIYLDCVRLASRAGCLISTHLSETREELQLTQTGTGPFRDLLKFRGLPVEEWKVPGASPVQYLSDLGVLEAPGLAIHLNYLEPGDTISLKQGQLTPVYCPQSHRFLGHTNHPALEILEQGIPLALGTDSLASNDSLEMLDEMRLLHELFPETPTEVWLRCATLEGARALRLDSEIGSLAPGKAADLAIVELGAPPPSDDPARALLAPGSHAVATIIEGEWLFGDR